jgi:deazaflavin-dependent oxidoreductase (nitroreductase family)
VRAAALVLLLATFALATEPPPSEIATTLERIKDRSTIDFTTFGRKTGKEHTRPIWFVVSNGKVLVQAGKGGKTDWYQNIQKTPMATIRSETYKLRVEAVPVTDAKRVEEIHRLFLEKYTSARLLSWIGSSIGRGEPVELTPLSVSVAREPASAN